jgi:HEAT repeats
MKEAIMGRLQSDFTMSELIKHGALGLALVLCCLGTLNNLAAACPVASVPLHAAAPRLAIAWYGDRLSVRVCHTPWTAVLLELERRTGITILVRGPLAGMLTQEFEALPLEQGLHQLFRGVNTVFFYRAGTDAGAAAGQLTQVWLWPKEGSAAAARPPDRSSASAEATREHDDSSSSQERAETSPSEEEAEANGETVATEEAEGERLEMLHVLAKQGDGEALQQAVFDPDPNVHMAAFAVLAERDPQGTVSLVVAAAKDAQPMVRLQALQFLQHGGLVEDASVLSTLGDALADADIAVRRYATQSLAERGGPEALGSLRQALRDPNPAIAKMILEQVIQIVPPDQSLPLFQEALSHADATVRVLASARLEQVVSEGR